MTDVRSTRIYLSEEAREESINILNTSLANTLYGVLASKFAHWNVKGTGFFPAHELFDKIYEFYSSAADKLGERITAIGGTAEGMLSDVSANSTVEYTADANVNVNAHMRAMADLLGQIGNEYRNAIEVTGDDEVKDFATQDLFIELCREADKLLYFLEADLRTE
jgi:starvation-inducible DNA-binding protein